MRNKEPAVDSQSQAFLSEKRVTTNRNHLADKQALEFLANRLPADKKRCALLGAGQQMGGESSVRIRGERDLSNQGCSPKYRPILRTKVTRFSRAGSHGPFQCQLI